jgi:hypothetical protein
MKSSRPVNVKVAAIENDSAATLLRSFVLVGFAVAATAFFVELAVAAILGLF